MNNRSYIFIFILTVFIIPGCVKAQKEDIINSIIQFDNLEIAQDSNIFKHPEQLSSLEKESTDIKFLPMTDRHPGSHVPGFIVSAALGSYGALAKYAQPLKRLDQNAHQSVTKHITRSFRIDDYIQYAPAMAVYALDITGTKAKHNFRDRTIIMVTSHLIMCATIQTMKHTINVKRPDGSNNKSFPSGHTATAFVGAHILFKEYKDTSPWIGIGGYAVAAATGGLRVVNKKHWISDVITGAGIGILTTEIGYLLLPSIQNLLGFKQFKNKTLTPVVEASHYGLRFSKSF